MHTDDEVILETAATRGEVEESRILSLYADFSAEYFHERAHFLVTRGYLDRAGTENYLITDRGLRLNKELNDASAQRVREATPTWQARGCRP